MATVAEWDIARGVVHRLLGRGAGAEGEQRALKPSLGGPQYALGHEHHEHEDAQTGRDPPIAQRVRAVAEGQEKEAEERYAIDGSPGPVHAGPEVPHHRFGEGGRLAQQPGESGGDDSAGRHRGQPGHHACHVEDQHDVECRSVRRLVHWDIFTQYGGAPGPSPGRCSLRGYLTLYRRERWER